MFRAIHMLKRKPHLTHEQFREHFERSHAPMALKFCGHLFRQYQRSYVGEAFGGDDSRKENSKYGPIEPQWDLLSEWTLDSEQDLYEIYRIMQTPEYDRYFREDEDRFIDRVHTVTMHCVVCDTGTAFRPENTVFDTPTGEPSWEGYENWTPLKRW